MLVVVFGFAFTWMFMLIGLVAGSAQAAQGMSLLVFPLTFVSSAYVPVDTMPGWMQAVRPQPADHGDGRRRPGAGSIDDPVAALGHSAWYFTVARPAVVGRALIVVFAPIAVARYR